MERSWPVLASAPDIPSYQPDDRMKQSCDNNYLLRHDKGVYMNFTFFGNKADRVHLFFFVQTADNFRFNMPLPNERRQTYKRAQRHGLS